MQQYKAFTLIEVLIAIIVLVIAFTALCDITRSNIRSSAALKTALASNSVALNVYSRMALGLTPKPQPGADTKGEETMLNDTWQWTATTNESITSNAEPERVIITVYQHGKPCHQLISFIR